MTPVFIGVADLGCDYVRKLSDEEAGFAVIPTSSQPVRLKRKQIDGVGFVRPVCLLCISTKLRWCPHMCVNL